MGQKRILCLAKNLSFVIKYRQDRIERPAFGGKDMKRLLFIAALVLVTICFAACGSDDSGNAGSSGVKGPYELEGIDLDDMVTFDIPKEYSGPAESRNGSKGEVIQQTWESGDSEITLSMLSYSGNGVIGMDGSLEDYIGDGFDMVDVVELDSPQPDAYITYVDGTADDGSEIQDNSIEAVFSCEDYVLSLELFNNEGGSITEDQKETFYKVLKSARFAELSEE